MGMAHQRQSATIRIRRLFVAIRAAANQFISNSIPASSHNSTSTGAEQGARSMTEIDGVALLCRITGASNGDSRDNRTRHRCHHQDKPTAPHRNAMTTATSMTATQIQRNDSTQQRLSVAAAAESDISQWHRMTPATNTATATATTGAARQ
jgi:hypothetical protein